MMGSKTYKEQKKEIRKRAQLLLESMYIDPKMIDSLECYIFDDQAALMKKSNIKAKGLTNDIETMPITLMYLDLKKETYEITEAGEVFFGLKEA